MQKCHFFSVEITPSAQLCKYYSKIKFDKKLGQNRKVCARIFRTRRQTFAAPKFFW